jgi:hypothetical protein
MTTLTEFLSTAGADSATALVQARAFSEQVLKPIDERMMNERTVMGLIGMESGETFMQSLEAAPDSVMPSRVKAWFKPSEAGIDVATPSAVGLIDAMAGAGAITEAESGVLKGYAYDTVTPFERITLHDVLITRGACPTVAVTQSGGYAVITTTDDTELHNPRLLALNPRTSAMVRIESFRGVSSAGTYDARVPSEWRTADLFVDDAYGVVGAG